MTRQPNFSNLVHVGTILLKYVKKDTVMQHIIAKGKRRIQAKAIEDKIYAGEAGFTKLTPGSTFGDFQEAKGRLYKSQCVVALSETVKCVMINSKDLNHLFAKILTPQNIRLIRGRIPTETISHNMMKKVARCFNEKTYPPGKVILSEGNTLKSIFIIKKGTCEVYVKQNPLKAPRDGKEDFFLRIPVTGEELCLGLNQGSMSRQFNFYPISSVGPGTWLGEEAFFSEVSELTYSVKC